VFLLELFLQVLLSVYQPSVASERLIVEGKRSNNKAKHLEVNNDDGMAGGSR
jgi:hypothetical protein